MPRRYDDDPGPWSLVARQYVQRDPPWLVLRRDHVRLPNGAEIANCWIQEYPPWVNVVAVTNRDDVVMVRQYRPGISGVHFEMPGGVVDASDPSLEAAARRELLEETGYGGGRWSALSTLSANPAMQTNLSHAFVAEGVELQEPSRPEHTEDLRVHLVPLAELAQLIDEGDVVQALHAAPLLRYLLARATRVRGG